MLSQGFPGGSDIKESSCTAGELSLILGMGRSPGRVIGYPLQYSCLENSTDIGPGGLKSTGCKELDTTERLSLHLCYLKQIEAF